MLPAICFLHFYFAKSLFQSCYFCACLVFQVISTDLMQDFPNGFPAMFFRVGGDNPILVLNTRNAGFPPIIIFLTGFIHKAEFFIVHRLEFAACIVSKTVMIAD